MEHKARNVFGGHAEEVLFYPVNNGDQATSVKLGRNLIMYLLEEDDLGSLQKLAIRAYEGRGESGCACDGIRDEKEGYKDVPPTDTSKFFYFFIVTFKCKIICVQNN